MSNITWWKLQWQNGYIGLFLFNLALAIFAFLSRNKYSYEGSEWGFYISMAIPVGAMTLIAYYGFHKYWKYIKETENKKD